MLTDILNVPTIMIALQVCLHHAFRVVVAKDRGGFSSLRDNDKSLLSRIHKLSVAVLHIPYSLLRFAVGLGNWTLCVTVFKYPKSNQRHQGRIHFPLEPDAEFRSPNHSQGA